MNLENIDIDERKKLTRAYPVLISSFPKAGKSAAVEFLPEEEKKRTVIFDVENKGLPEDDESQYRSVYRFKPSDIDPKSKGYKDHGNIKYLTIEEMMKRIQLAIGHKDIDRVVIDSFTAFVAEFERHYVTTSNGFTVWNKYNQMLHDFFALVKEETHVHGKFVYILGHYKPAKDKKDTESERFTQVKGKDHFRMVESNFNTVIGIRDFKFFADNRDEFSSTRIKRTLDPYESEENSLAELELALTGTKTPA